MDRNASFAAILAAYPGNDAPTQCKRLHAALMQLGPITTVEARSGLDLMMPAARVHELRHKEGLNIVTYRVDRPTEAGLIHRVGIYALLPTSRGNA